MHAITLVPQTDQPLDHSQQLQGEGEGRGGEGRGGKGVAVCENMTSDDSVT